MSEIDQISDCMPLYAQDSAHFNLKLDHLILDRLPIVCPTEIFIYLFIY